MKIYIHSEELKSAASRLANILIKKSCFAAYYSFLIETEGDYVRMKACCDEAYCTVQLCAKVIEPGAVMISYEDMEKITLVKGSMFIKSDGNICRAWNDKKKTEVCSLDTKIYPEFPVVEKFNEFLFVNDIDNFMETLKVLSVSLSDNPAKPLYNGFNFKTATGRVTTMDGFRITSRKVDWFVDSEINEITISGRIYKDLKALVGKSTSAISVYTDRKNVLFVGVDFNYIVKAVGDGKVAQFMLWEDGMLDNYNPNCEFEIVNPKDFKDVMKEYAKYNKKFQNPCHLSSYDGDLLTFTENTSYRTFDRIETDGNITDDLFISANPNYLQDAINVFLTVGAQFTIRYKNAITPMVFIGGDYVAVVVPMRSETYHAATEIRAKYEV